MAHGAGPLPDSLSAIDGAPCGLLQTQADGLILWANQTFCRWTGHDLDDLRARRLQDLFTMGGRIFHQTHWAPLLQMQGSISEVKLEIVKRDGERLPAIMNAILHDSGGRLLQEVALYVARDRDKYERELLLSRRKLQEAVAEAERLKEQARDRALFAEQMIGIVSHDLRNPLSTIQMGAAVLARTGVSATQQTVLDRITRSTDRANRMISELLDFTQARLGNGLAVNPRPVQLRLLVKEAVEDLRLAFPGRLLACAHEGSEESCNADPDRLVQLIGNLAGNALAYGSADQPVTVTSRVDAARFSIAVHNLGAPIPADLLERMFLPLTRGDTGGTGQRSVGLGLYIVSEIARAHGGTVSVRSDAATGTAFEAVFPRAPGTSPP